MLFDNLECNVLASICSCIPGIKSCTFSEKAVFPEPEGPAKPTCITDPIVLLASHQEQAAATSRVSMHLKVWAHHDYALVVIRERLNGSNEYIEALQQEIFQGRLGGHGRRQQKYCTQDSILYICGNIGNEHDSIYSR